MLLTHQTTSHLQQAVAASGGRLPEGIALILAGHVHLGEVLSFADKRAPQFVLGTGGTLLARKIKRSLTGAKIAGTTVSYSRTDHRFGFAKLEAGGPDGHWVATFRDAAGKKLFACKVRPGEATCN